MNLPAEDFEIFIGDQLIERIGSDMPVKYLKFLGHFLDDNLNWEFHIRNIQKRYPRVIMH